MNSCAIAADMTQREGQAMTPADKSAMIGTWADYHFGIDLDLLPDVPPACKRMYAAGLAHAREQAAAQLEARAAEVAQCDCTQCSNAAAELREQAEKIRSGE